MILSGVGRDDSSNVVVIQGPVKCHERRQPAHLATNQTGSASDLSVASGLLVCCLQSAYVSLASEILGKV